MKLLLIDDEPHVIEALRLLESWGKWGFDLILEANSIQRARELALQELPDLVITDILLPDGTGVDLIHTLNELPVVPQIIAVSGHSDFCYVRPALSAGCIDYLLKPIDPVDLHKSVSRAMDALQLQRQQKASHEKMTQLSKMYREKLVCDLLLQRNTVDALNKLNQSLPVGSSAQCRVLLFDTDCLRTGGDAFPADLLARLSANCSDTDFIVCQDSTFPGQCIVIYLGGEEAFAALSKRLLQQLSAQRLPFCVGCSEVLLFPSQLPIGYQHARDALLHSPATPEQSALTVWSVQMEAPQEPVTPADTRRQLLSACLTGDESQMQAALTRWLAPLYDTPLTIGTCRQVSHAWQKILSDWIKTYRERYPGRFSMQPPKTLHFADYLDSQGCATLMPAVQAMSVQAMDLAHSIRSSRPDRDMIYQIEDYLQLNYSQPFNQAECAARFFINKDYMCRKFKTVFHMNMVNYLHILRIDHAKTMLRATDWKVSRIAHEVGYPDEKYFSKQFKILEGMTPMEYRNSF